MQTKLTHPKGYDLDPAQAEIRIKVFIVMQRMFAARGDKPNTKVLSVKLNLAEAQGVVDRIPGTYIVRQFATKTKAKKTKPKPDEQAT